MPKTKEQNEAIKLQTKEKILSAALRTFSQYGYNGSSMSMIAKRAHISKGLTYNYFPSKKEILEFLISRHVDQLKKEFNITKKGTQEEKIRQAISGFCNIIIKNEHTIRLTLLLIIQPGLHRIIFGRKRIEERVVKYIFPHFQEIFKSIGYDQNYWDNEETKIIIYGLIFYYLWERDKDSFRQLSIKLLSPVIQK